MSRKIFFELKKYFTSFRYDSHHKILIEFLLGLATHKSERQREKERKICGSCVKYCVIIREHERQGGIGREGRLSGDKKTFRIKSKASSTNAIHETKRIFAEHSLD